MFRPFFVATAFLSAVLLTGCATAKQASAPSNQEPRKSVTSSETKSPQTIKETEDGKYYIMMDQSERLCSDCDR